MSVWDDEAGYDRDDPKHPDWAERMAEAADLARKRAKENRVELCGAMGEEGDGPCVLLLGHPGLHSDGDARW